MTKYRNTLIDRTPSDCLKGTVELAAEDKHMPFDSIKESREFYNELFKKHFDPLNTNFASLELWANLVIDAPPQLIRQCFERLVHYINNDETSTKTYVVSLNISGTCWDNEMLLNILSNFKSIVTGFGLYECLLRFDIAPTSRLRSYSDIIEYINSWNEDNAIKCNNLVMQYHM